MTPEEAPTASSRAGAGLDDLVGRAQAEPAFDRLGETMRAIGAESWLTEPERALLFAIGAYAPGEGRIVEIGSWKGASACLLAGGLARRGQGRLTCVDPHAGGPPWLGLAPFRSTLESFRTTTTGAGVASLLDMRVGDSLAVAGSWPAQPLDAVFIDGDHSLIGALRDFECWAPKLRAGGVVLLDDVDQLVLPGLLALVEDLKRIPGVSWLGTIDGMAAFRRDADDSWRMLDALGERMADRGVHRSRDTSKLLSMTAPSSFLRSRNWEDPGLDTAYELCFLARCGPGPYAHSAAVGPDERAVLRAVSVDRGDGEVVELPGAGACRVVVCLADEVERFGTALQAGGVLLVPNDRGEERSLPIHQSLLGADFEGCDWLGRLHWGVRQPHVLSPDAVLERAIAVLAEPAESAPDSGPPIVAS